MRAVDLIQKKKEGLEHTQEEINFLVEKVSQISAITLFVHVVKNKSLLFYSLPIPLKR